VEAVAAAPDVSWCVVIPSARATNLIPCVQAVWACEPSAAIIVVDDGAKAESEGALPGVTWVTGAKPFGFARNVNLGIVAAGRSDVILLNDDAQLLTPSGFSQLADHARYASSVGICSAGIRGVVCNVNQIAREPAGYREEGQQLAFVCVYIRRAVIDRIGLLDERFTAYGFEDFDYCRRVRDAGFRLAIWDGCVVDHTGDTVPSTFRTRLDLPDLLASGRQLYDDKWGCHG
jgi:GT2 family glycosyltransferase